VRQSVAGLNELQRSSILKDPVSRRQILEDLVNQEVVAQVGEKLKLDQEPEFKELMAYYRKQALMARVLEKEISSQMTQKAVKNYYEQHKDEYSTDRVRIQQIVVSDEAEANKILKLAQDSKNDFQGLAEKYSKDPEAKNNRGEMGYIGHDRLAPEFVRFAFATPEGKVAGPVHTVFGYHIVKVIHKKYGKALELHEVELQVRNALRQQLIKTYVDSARLQAKVKIDDAAVDKFQQ
jgi:peptidyl-prolyl cis-trans isomerase C